MDGTLQHYGVAGRSGRKPDPNAKYRQKLAKQKQRTSVMAQKKALKAKLKLEKEKKKAMKKQMKDLHNPKKKLGKYEGDLDDGEYKVSAKTQAYQNRISGLNNTQTLSEQQKNTLRTSYQSKYRNSLKRDLLLQPNNAKARQELSYIKDAMAAEAAVKKQQRVNATKKYVTQLAANKAKQVITQKVMSAGQKAQQNSKPPQVQQKKQPKQSTQQQQPTFTAKDVKSLLADAQRTTNASAQRRAARQARRKSLYQSIFGNKPSNIVLFNSLIKAG